MSNQSNKPLVSVILSVFNDDERIKEAVESILNQTYENFELLIMDDGSTDRTFEIINSFKNNKIKIFQNQKNIGLTKSLNILIKNSNGDYIARQDSDDISLHNRLDKQYNFMNNKNLDACTTRAYIRNSKNSIPRFSHLLPTDWVIKYKNPFIHGTLLIKKEALFNVGLYDERYQYSQDYKLYLELLDKNYIIKTLNKKLYVLNMTNNISNKKKDEQRRDFEKIKNNYFN